MSEDDKEKERTGLPGRLPGRLPTRVERALERAREIARDPKGTSAGRWLAFVPVAVAALMLLLVMPRGSTPEDVPAPAIDQRALDVVLHADRARAAAARVTRLPPDVLAVGTGVRAIQAGQVKGDEEAVYAARAKMDDAMRGLATRPGALEDLLTLRAVQTEEFLAEVERFERSGEGSKELEELAGAFVVRMREAWWIEGGRVVLNEAQRRVTYKLVWNTVAAVDSLPQMQLTLDEQRVLYSLYFEHPHPPETLREALLVERRNAKTPAACERYEANARRATELWRADKIRRFGGVDPTYPTDYALGVALYRAGRYESAIDHFRGWVDAHPDGKWSLRARNHLRAAVTANGAI